MAAQSEEDLAHFSPSSTVSLYAGLNSCHNQFVAVSADRSSLVGVTRSLENALLLLLPDSLKFLF